MEGNNHLIQHSNSASAVSAAVNFGGTASVLARLGRPIPGPFAHFGSPIAPYSMPSLAHPYDFHSPHHFQPSLAVAAAAAATVTAYSIDSLLHASSNANSGLISSLTPSTLVNQNFHRRESTDNILRVNGKKGKNSNNIAVSDRK
jgi:hypothetical protein